MSPSTTAACFTGHTIPSVAVCALRLVAFPISRVPLLLDVVARVPLKVFDELFEVLFDFRDFFRFSIILGGAVIEGITAKLCGCAIAVDRSRVRGVVVEAVVSGTEGSLDVDGEITVSGLAARSDEGLGGDSTWGLICGFFLNILEMSKVPMSV